MKLFDTYTEGTIGYAAAIWDNSNGDMLAHRIFTSSHEATKFTVRALQHFVNSGEFVNIPVSVEIKRFEA